MKWMMSAVVGLLLLAGCSAAPDLPPVAEISEADYEAVQAGEECQPIVERWGEPTTSTTTTVDLPDGGQLVDESYAWNTPDGRTIALVCQNGVVLSKSVAQ